MVVTPGVVALAVSLRSALSEFVGSVVLGFVVREFADVGSRLEAAAYIRNEWCTFGGTHHLCAGGGLVCVASPQLLREARSNAGASFWVSSVAPDVSSALGTSGNGSVPAG